MSLLKAMATVGGFTFASRITGFLRDVLTANILGAGPAADAFIVALKLPNFFRRVTGEGAFSVSFIPMYSKKMEAEGKDPALAFAGQAASVMVTILLPFVVLAIIFMPWVIYGLAPGFQDDPVRYGLAVAMTQITFPYLLFISVAALFGGVLNAAGYFAPFAAAPILFNISWMGGLYFGAHYLDYPAQTLATAISFSGILQCGWLYFCLRKLGYRIPVMRPKLNEDMRKLFKLMGPGILGAGVYQINMFADMMIASLLATGAISHLYYADRLNQLPLSVIGVAIGTALLPMFSKALAAKNHHLVRDLYNRSIEYGLILCLPAAAALMICAPPIISTLFEHGQFTAKDSAATSVVLSLYAMGLPAYVISKVFATTYWADQDTKTPVKIAIISALVNIVLSLIFIQFMGVAGIALSTAISGWLQIYLLWRGVRSHAEIRFDDRLRQAMPKIALSTAVMGLCVLGFAIGLQDFFHSTVFIKSLALVGLVVVSMIVYGACIFVSGVLSIQELRTYFSRKIKT